MEWYREVLRRRKRKKKRRRWMRVKKRRQVLWVVGRIVGRLLMFLSRQVLRTNVSHVNLKEEKLILSQAGTWDLGPFAAVLAPGQTSPQAAEYKLLLLSSFSRVRLCATP